MHTPSDLVEDHTAAATQGEEKKEEDNDEIVLPNYIHTFPTSPFSEAWGQYRLEVDTCRWHKATKGPAEGRWVRALWGNELYQERRSASTGRYVDTY